MMNLTHKAAEVFANDLYATQATGVRFVEVGEDYAKCTLDIQPIHRNAMGGVMGGVLFTLSVDKLISLYGSHHINISTYQHINKTHSRIHAIIQASSFIRSLFDRFPLVFPFTKGKMRETYRKTIRYRTTQHRAQKVHRGTLG